MCRRLSYQRHEWRNYLLPMSESAGGLEHSAGCPKETTGGFNRVSDWSLMWLAKHCDTLPFCGANGSRGRPRVVLGWALARSARISLQHRCLRGRSSPWYCFELCIEACVEACNLQFSFLHAWHCRLNTIICPLIVAFLCLAFDRANLRSGWIARSGRRQTAARRSAVHVSKQPSPPPYARIFDSCSGGLSWHKNHRKHLKCCTVYTWKTCIDIWIYNRYLHIDIFEG